MTGHCEQTPDSESIMRILIVQHLDIEPPALLGQLLQSAGCQLETVRLDRGDALPPNRHGFDGALIMGGPQSANDTDLDYIAAELTWLAHQIDAGLPLLGICLGAQMMARAAGAAICPSPVRELGWYGICPTPESSNDPLFSTLPAHGMQIFQWHGETFTMPESATLVATNPAVPNQAFRLGNGQYGIQFHTEVDPALIEQWIHADASAHEHLGDKGIAALQCATTKYLPAMHDLCRRLTDGWLADVSNYRKSHAHGAVSPAH